jgi:hypothetical protein
MFSIIQGGFWGPQLMPKKTTHNRTEKGRPTTEEPTPPLLSEKLIAQLQQAVKIAQHRRIPRDVPEGNSADKDY